MAQYRRIPTNQNLIKGAGFAASGATNTGGFVDSSAAIDKSFAQAEKRIQVREAKARAAAEKKAIEDRRKAAEAEKIQARNRAELNKQKNKMASLQAQLQSNVDTSSLSSPSNINAVKDFVVGKRNRYVEIASELSKMSPFDDKYAELTSELNNVQSSIVNLAGDLKKYSTKEVEFVNDFDETSVTNGDKDRIESTNLFFDPNNTLTISDSGDASFGGVNVKDFDLPAYKQIDAAELVNNEIAKRVRSARPLTESDRNQLRTYLEATTKGKNTIDSFLSDGLLGENVVKDIKAYMIANPEADKKTAFLEGTLNNVERLSQAAYDTVQANAGTGKLTERDRMINNAKKQWDLGGIIKLKGNQILEKQSGTYVLKRLNSQTNTYEPLKTNGSIITVENKEALSQQF